MRILMLSHGYPPTISGVSLVAQKVARAMVRRGHTITMVTASRDGHASREEDEGVILERVNSWPNPYWSEGRLPITSLKQFREIMDVAQPDIVHSHDSGLLGFQLVREDREGEVPKVLTCHFLPEYVSRYVGWIDTLKRPIEKTVWDVAVRLLNQFDRVVFPTSTQRQAFLEHGLEVPTTVISNGVDISRYQPVVNGDGDIARRYKLPNAPRILFVGRVARDKEIDVLIRAMAQPWAEHGAHLLIVGRGDDRSRLGELARSEQLEHCTHFLGFVPEEDLPGLYREIDIFTIAATVEVQSIPTLQAVATAKPVVAVKAAALPELVHDGQNGYLVPPEDPPAMGRALSKLLGDSKRAQLFGKNSLAIGREHAEEATFDAYESLYEQLLAEEARNITGSAN
ncbi:MAG: glycosyltransferase [Candidatus Promineifilaceae bacterium]